MNERLNSVEAGSPGTHHLFSSPEGKSWAQNCRGRPAWGRELSSILEDSRCSYHHQSGWRCREVTLAWSADWWVGLLVGLRRQSSWRPQCIHSEVPFESVDGSRFEQSNDATANDHHSGEDASLGNPNKPMVVFRLQPQKRTLSEPLASEHCFHMFSTFQLHFCWSSCLSSKRIRIGNMFPLGRCPVSGLFRLQTSIQRLRQSPISSTLVRSISSRRSIVTFSGRPYNRPLCQPTAKKVNWHPVRRLYLDPNTHQMVYDPIMIMVCGASILYFAVKSFFIERNFNKNHLFKDS